MGESGQARDLGVQPNWVWLLIEGAPYSRELLRQHLAGDQPFEATFQIGEASAEKAAAWHDSHTKAHERHQKAKEAYDNSSWFGASEEVSRELDEAHGLLPKAHE